MEPDDYRGYLHRALLLPVYARTVAALAGVILRRPPRVTASDSLVDRTGGRNAAR